MQVSIFLQWLQWLHIEVLRDAERIVVNFDETPLTRTIVPRRGYNLFNRKCTRLKVHAPIPSRETRSHVACIVDDADVQSHISQFLMTKDTMLNRLEKRDCALCLHH